MEMIGISGSHGFLGEQLVKRFNFTQVRRFGRDGKIDGRLDVVFDLAAYGNLHGRTSAKKIYKANLTRLINEIENLSGNEKFIFVSTSSVLLPVQTLYSLSKKAAEDYIKYIQAKTGMKMAIARPYTIVGMGEQKEHLIPRLIDSCLNGTLIPFVLDPVHDFVSSDDFIDALLLIKDKGKLNGEIYNIGTGRGTSNQEIKEIVEKITGKKANIRVVKNMRIYDNQNWVADSFNIRQLGWKPKKSLEKVIEEMVYARKNS